MKKFILFFAIFIISLGPKAQTVATFENLPLAPDTYWTGNTISGGLSVFGSGNAYFENFYDTSFGGYWDYGFAYSNKTDSVTAGYSNQYSAITAGGYNGSSNYAVAYDGGDTNTHPVIVLDSTAAGGVVFGFYITNSTYAYKSMLNGDNFEHAFNVDSGDWFKLRISGWYNGSPLADTIDFYLADYRLLITDTAYIINTWQWVDLTPMGNVDSLFFILKSSQNDSFGSLTPTYFCMDNFVTGDMPNIYVTINYEQDTIINVLNNLRAALSPPLTVQIVSGPVIPGASAVIDSAQNIYYVPAIGVEAVDTVTYTICDTSGHCSEAQIVINVLPLVQGIRATDVAAINVYPNPFVDYISIRGNGNIQAVQLYDEAGKLIISEAFNNGPLSLELKTAELSSGIYVAKIVSAEGTTFAKVIKE